MLAAEEKENRHTKYDHPTFVCLAGKETSERLLYADAVAFKLTY